MAKEPKRLEKWAYAARWFGFPISFAGWLSARMLVLIFGVSEWGRRDGYIHILLLRNRELHEYVPPWLAYLYNSASVLVIASIALVAIHAIVEQNSPQA